MNAVVAAWRQWALDARRDGVVVGDTAAGGAWCCIGAALVALSPGDTSIRSTLAEFGGAWLLRGVTWQGNVPRGGALLAVLSCIKKGG